MLDKFGDPVTFGFYSSRYWEIGTPWIMSVVWDHPSKGNWCLEVWMSGKKKIRLGKGRTQKGD